MSEHLQLPLFPTDEDSQSSNEFEFRVFQRLESIADRLGYESSPKEGLIRTFLRYGNKRTSILESTATAVAMMKNGWLDETAMQEHYSGASVQALKRGLILLEGVSGLDDIPEDDLSTVWTVTEIISNELLTRGYDKFVDGNYSGTEWY